MHKKWKYERSVCVWVIFYGRAAVYLFFDLKSASIKE